MATFIKIEAINKIILRVNPSNIVRYFEQVPGQTRVVLTDGHTIDTDMSISDLDALVTVMP